MDLILLEKVKNVGDLGDTVSVRPGYARNYLLPRGMALPATDANRKVYEQRKAELVKKAADSLNAARVRAENIESTTLTIPMLVSDEGKLYGSVGPSEIVQGAAMVGVPLERYEIDMPEGSIRTVGTFEVLVRVHSELAARLSVVVEEAKAS